MKSLLERAALSPHNMENVRMGPAFKDRARPHLDNTPQLICETDKNAERYFAALNGGHGYFLVHIGVRRVNTGEITQLSETYDICRERANEKIGSAETYTDPKGKLQILAFEIVGTELLTLSMIARAMKEM